MRILVCGSRHFDDPKMMQEVLDEIYFKDQYEEFILIEGEARGADTLSRLWAEGLGIPVLRFPADWNTHGKRAGPIRNSQMLKEGKPTLVVAFMFKDSRGTKNMVEQATKAGIPVRVIHCE